MDADRAATLLELARREFPAFYTTASATEIEALEALVIARAEYVAGITQPRATLSVAERMCFERETDAREREFAALRDAVQKSAPFRSLPVSERDRLTRILLEPPRSLA